MIGWDVDLRETLVLAALYIILASNLNIMLGYTGYVNFGSIVFFGLGGYVCLWLVSALRLAARLQRCLAPASASACWRWFSGSESCGCAAHFFALATIGVIEAVQAFVQNFAPWGGSAGPLSVERRPQAARRPGAGVVGRSIS